jgi:uncharacterized protein (TIGR00369 family)
MNSVFDSFPSVPVNEFFGFGLLPCEGGSASVSFRPERRHTQEYGVVHGGILSALADTAAVYTVRPTLEPSAKMTSIEFKINFLAAAHPGRGDVVADAKLIRKGKSVAVVQVDVHQSDIHVATRLFTYIIIPKTRPAT